MWTHAHAHSSRNVRNQAGLSQLPGPPARLLTSGPVARRLSTMISFDTVLIAAGTSAAVALAVEWAAKPRLEARKERILDEHRSRREVVRHVRRIVQICSMLRHDITADGDEASKVQGFLNARRAELVRIGEDMEVKALAYFLKSPNARARSVLGGLIGLTQGVALSSKPTKEVARQLLAVAGPALNYHGSPRWRIRYRRTALLVAEIALNLPPGSEAGDSAEVTPVES